MRPVYIISGGITKFAKAHPEKDFRFMVKEAFDYALQDVPNLTRDKIDGSVCSYFSDHFTRQLKAGAMVQDYLGLCPKPSKRVEGGGATGGLCLQAAWEAQTASPAALTSVSTEYWQWPGIELMRRRTPRPGRTK